jgi:hypothetical protein
VSTERVLAADLPHYQHLTHLRNCWRTNLDWQASKWAKVGVAAARPPCQLICNMPPRRCPNPLRCFVFDSETVYELVSHAKTHLRFRKCAAQQNTTAQSQLTEMLNFCELRDGNVSFPDIRTVIQLPVGMP